jgi:type I restriction enzyme, S subunit
MNWKKVKLGEICEINMGKTPSRANPKYWGEGNNWVSIADLSSTKNECFIKKTKEQITDLAVKESGIKVVPSNTLLYSFKLSIGKVAITQTPLFTNEAIVALPIKVKDELDVKYLYHAIQRVNLDGVGDKAVMGITLNKEKLKVLEIPLPDLATQKHIAEVLDKADALRQQNRQLLANYDELLQSTFIELFGDPVKNPKGWEVKPVIDTCEGCIVPGRDKPKSFTGNIPWITTDDLIHLWATEKSNKNLGLSEIELKEVKARRIPKDSVIMTCVGDLGIVSVAKKELVMNQQLHAFICGDKIDKYFLAYSLSHRTDFMYKMASTTTVPYMNKTVCNSIPIPTPPLPLQQHFAKIVEQIEAQKAQAQAALAESEALFEGLLAGYFK